MKCKVIARKIIITQGQTCSQSAGLLLQACAANTLLLQICDSATLLFQIDIATPDLSCCYSRSANAIPLIDLVFGLSDT